MGRSKPFKQTTKSTSVINFWINPNNQITTSGIAAANYEIRKVIQQALFSSSTSDQLWNAINNPGASYVLFLHIIGDTFSREGVRLHHFHRKSATPCSFGGKATWQSLYDTVEHFKAIKIDPAQPGYIESGKRVIIRSVRVEIEEEIHVGGAGKRFTKPDSFPITDIHYAREAKLRLQYGDLRTGEDPNLNNNCAFRAIFDQLTGTDDKKWFKENFNLKLIRKEFNLPQQCKISPQDLIRICEARKFYVEIIIVRGMEWNKAEYTSIECNKELCTDLRHRRVILHTDVEHYYVGTVGKTLGSTGDSECINCGERVPDKDAIHHQLIHKLKAEFKVPFDLPSTAILPEEGESFEQHSERHTSIFVKIFKEFYDDENSDNILGIMGPGGCGKSYVVKKFKELYPDIDVRCIAMTGVAAQNIEGVTYHSFMMKLRSMTDLPDLIIIDEISLVSANDMDKIHEALMKKTGYNSVMGGIKTIVMGDFLQLPPYSGDGKDVKPCLNSEVIYKHLHTVPMLYGFRYKDDPDFYKLLLQLRSSHISKKEFLRAGFGMLRKHEWIHNYTPENRPTMLVIKNKRRKELEDEAREYDMSMEGIKVDHVSINITKIIPDNDGTKLSLMQQKLCGSFKGRIERDVAHPQNRRGENLSFETALSKSEFDCIINTDKKYFYVGEKLMTLKNNCDDEKLLMNGSEVTFHSIQRNGEDEFMIVKNKDGNLCSIPKVTRGCNIDGSFYYCDGFPIQSAIVSTIFKAQGKTYSSIVVDIPNIGNVAYKHLYYVAISRCITAKTVNFMVRPSYSSTIEGLELVYERFYSPKRNVKPLIEHNACMVNVMKYTETGGPIRLVPDLDRYLDLKNSSSFPNPNNGKFWTQSLPAKASSMEQHRKLLTGNIIVFDIETGAQVGFEDHQKHFNDDDERIFHESSMRHDQTPWLISFLHIRDARIIWMKDELRNAENQKMEQHLIDTLRLLVDLQDTDTGIVHIQLDRDEGDYCQIHFVTYLMYECYRLEYFKKLRLNQLRFGGNNANLSRYDRLPCTVVGFNSDNFDSKSIIYAMEQAKTKVPDRLFPFIIPNSGSAITKLICKSTSRDKYGNLLTTHDLFRYMGCVYGLKATHESLIAKPYGSNPDKFEEFVDLYTHDTVLSRNILKHGKMGKGEFPHLLTQQKGYPVTLSKEVKLYPLKYYPDNMHSEVIDEDSRRFSIYHKAREYMNGDIYCLLGAYMAANESLGQDLCIPILNLNTAQQKTTANFLMTGSDIPGLVKQRRTDVYGEKTDFDTRFSLPNTLVQDFTNKSTYGGKTLARRIEWNHREGDGTYNQQDESGMYSAAQQNCNYPYGSHQYTSDRSYCDRALKSYNMMANGDCMKDPGKTDFPFMYIADVTIQIPTLCIDPTLPFRDMNGEVNWGVSDEMSNGVRRQHLTSIHLGTLKNMGGKILHIHSLVFWYKYGPVYERYVRKLNKIKYTTKDPVKKLMAKLDTNALYGASLKQDVATVTETYRYHSEYEELCKSKIDPLQLIDRCELDNGLTRIVAMKRADLAETSSRPTYVGAFVLAHSQYKLNKLEMVAFGPTFIPKTLADARDGLIHQPLYGDTDSLYLHNTHIDRLVQHASTPGGVNYLYDTKSIVDPKQPTVDELVDKLGRYCDEVANDNGCADLVDYEEGIYTTVHEFACGAPKAYTCAYQMPNGEMVYKNSIKGVKRDSKIALMHPGMDRKRALEETEIRFNKKSKLVHEQVYEAIVNDNVYLSTRYDGAMKNFGLMPQAYEKTTDQYGVTSSRQPNTYSNTNVNRDVFKQVNTRRRFLTSEEVSFLQLDEYNSSRILVPTGWNSDGALFNLV